MLLSFPVLQLLTSTVEPCKTGWFNQTLCRLEAFSVVQLNSSLQLSLALYTDVSFTNTYNRIIRLWSDDFLFVEVRLQTNKTFASDVLVQLESCWATETSDPDNPIQGVLLQDRWDASTCCFKVILWLRLSFKTLIGTYFSIHFVA